jgi:WD40 repeat protein
VFSPDGLLLAGDSIISIESNTVLWDVASAREHFRMRWPGPYEGIQRIAFAPDGKTLTSVSGTDVKLLDLATREVRTLATGHVTAVRCLAYSPDGTILGTGGNDLIIKLFDTQTHEVRAVLLGHRELIQFLAFSPDGNTLASASAKGELKLWDVFMGQELVTLSGHWHSVGCLTFSPDGARLAIAGETSEKSGEVMIWHAPRRDE